ncbi:MAG TPA: heavy metal translocating P-type ATPase, partial [Jatrophihabitans sp.]|nr:heavy metal translocating P-type ATPase [Jatrophihabitans sp.]
VDLLMVVAAVVAALIGQVLDGALLIIIFATSGALEAVATKRTRDSVGALLDLAPDRANRIDEHGKETPVDAVQLAVTDLIRVRPGERIAADGVVVEGRSDVDQASITGESLPVFKQSGAEVFAGTMNGTGALVVRVSRRSEDSVVARIVTMVEQASETKAKAQLFIENIEQKYSIGMVTATLLLFFVPLAAGGALQPTLLRAITFMIVASPCAVVLATMPPLLSAIANAGRHGVLVKSAVVMEQLGQTDLIAFDKTGTLTEGRQQVAHIEQAPGAMLDATESLMLAAAVELNSQHPLADAIVSAAGPDVLPHADHFHSEPGRGVRALVAGHRVEVSAPQRLSVPARPSQVRSLDELVRARQQEGMTVVIVAVDGRAELAISLTDKVRPDASAAVADLAGLTTQPPVLITGDNHFAAAALARTVGLQDVRADLLPEAKVEVVRQLEQAGRRVTVIGDGVNDAPAMAAAHLGIAMGRRGADLALDTADAVIVRDELSEVGRVIRLSRRARRVVLANLAMAATVIAVLVVWDLVGTLPLPLGVAGHEGSTVLVGLNGLRLLRSTAWYKSRP